MGLLRVGHGQYRRYGRTVLAHPGGELGYVLLLRLVADRFGVAEVAKQVPVETAQLLAQLALHYGPGPQPERVQTDETGCIGLVVGALVSFHRRDVWVVERHR